MKDKFSWMCGIIRISSILVIENRDWLIVEPYPMRYYAPDDEE